MGSKIVRFTNIQPVVGDVLKIKPTRPKKTIIFPTYYSLTLTFDRVAIALVNYNCHCLFCDWNRNRRESTNIIVIIIVNKLAWYF